MNSLFIFGAKYLIIVPVVIAVWYFLKLPRNKKKEFIIFGITTLVTIGILALLASHLYYNPRPFVVGNFTPLIPHASDNGFPSDHMLLASALAVIVYFYSRKTATVLWILAILIGSSRVLVGVHHWIDIAGSVLIALVGAYLSFHIIKKMKPQNATEQPN